MKRRLQILLLVLVLPIIMMAQVGINEQNPTQQLDINGKIEIGDDSSSPTEGSIRYNAQRKDFEGWNGSAWISLTKKGSGWGNQSVTENSKTSGNNFAYDGSVFVTVFDGNVRVYNYFNGQISVVQSIYPPIGLPEFDAQIAMHGNYLLINASVSTAGIPEDYRSYVYVYEKQGNSWNFSALINDPEDSPYSFFGSVIDIYDSYFVASSPYSNDGAGKVYLYKRTGNSWNLHHTFYGSSPTADFGFGFSISIDGNNVAIAEPGNHKVYTYRDSFTLFGWVSAGTFTSPVNGFDFGNAVDLDNDRLVVGSGDNNSHIYEKSNGVWSATPSFSLDRSTGRVKIEDDLLVILSSPHKAILYKKQNGSWGEVAEFEDSTGRHFSIIRNIEIANDDTIILNAWNDEVNFYYKR